MSTGNAAAALGLAKDTGSIEAGKWCDLAVWDADRPAQVLLPGLRTIDLAPGAYSLENQRGEKVSRLHPGLAAIFHADIPAPPPGVAVRTV